MALLFHAEVILCVRLKYIFYFCVSKAVTKAVHFLCSFRLLVQVSTEICNVDDEMSMTFGCSLKDCRHLLESAKELGVQVVGVR